MASWASALELASVSDLVGRRKARAAADGDRRVMEHAVDEVAAALTLTRRAGRGTGGKLASRYLLTDAEGLRERGRGSRRVPRGALAPVPRL